MASTTRIVTYDEWLGMPVVEDAIEEVVNGEIRIMPPNKWLHSLTVEKLADALRRQVDTQTVQIVTAIFGLVIRRDPLTCRVPDLALFRKSNIVEQDGYIHSAPELVVEVLSPSDRPADRQEKLRDYESIAVPEVWVVSPEARTIEVLLLEGGTLQTAALLSHGELRPKYFREAVVNIASIWPK
jgi:Uma2 family endonuclease